METYRPKFNYGSTDPANFPVVDPYNEQALAASTGIVAVAVTTIWGERAAKQMDYTFPNLDGQGAVHFGLSPVPISWRLEYAVQETGGNTAAENAIKFEKKLLAYLKTAQRFPLTDEFGRTYLNVQLRRVTPVGPLERRGDGNAFIRELRVDFLWQQPSVLI